MGFQCMGRDLGIIAPYFMQQRIARHGLTGGAVKKFQYIGFFFGQANFRRAVLRLENFQARAK